MTERKLRLVVPAPELPAGAFDDELPPTEEELRAAAALRDALEAEREPAAVALRAAWSESDLSPADHDAVVARALGDPLAPPTELEAREAERLREALDAGEGDDASLLRALAAAATPAELDLRVHEVILARVLDDPLAEPSPGELEAAARLRDALEAPGDPAFESRDARLALALRAAYAPSAIEPARNDHLVARALQSSRRRMRATVVRIAGALALAAGALLAIRVAGTSAPPAAAPAAALIPARSTADLFDAAEPFPRTGGESARIDRIATARAADLRANRFAAWGAR